jgi:hypothetical protein
MIISYKYSKERLAVNKQHTNQTDILFELALNREKHQQGKEYWTPQTLRGGGPELQSVLKMAHRPKRVS